jgi:hypothetical protein
MDIGFIMDINSYIDYYANEFADTIEFIHENYSWSKRDSLKMHSKHAMIQKILMDASRQEYLGYIGLARCYENQIKMSGCKVTDGNTIVDKSAIYANVAKHIEEKLKHISSNFYFPQTHWISLNGPSLDNPIREFMRVYNENAD